MGTRTSNKLEHIENVKINILGISLHADRISNQVFWGFLFFTTIIIIAIAAILIILAPELSASTVLVKSLLDKLSTLKNWIGNTRPNPPNT